MTPKAHAAEGKHGYFKNTEHQDRVLCTIHRTAERMEIVPERHTEARPEGLLGGQPRQLGTQMPALGQAPPPATPPLPGADRKSVV